MTTPSLSSNCARRDVYKAVGLQNVVGPAIVLLVAHCFLPAQSLARQTPDAAAASFERGHYAWDAGDYLIALDAFDSALRGSTDESILRKIALETGEWYHTTEVAPDGTAPTWSPSGRHLAYTTNGDNGAKVHILAFRDGTVSKLLDVPGRTVSFSGAGESGPESVVYLRVNEGPALDAARDEARKSIQVRSRADFMRLREALAAADARATDVVIRDVGNGRERRLDTGRRLVFWAAFRPTTSDVLIVTRERDAADGYDLFVVPTSGSERRIAGADGLTAEPLVASTGQHVVWSDGDEIHVIDIRNGASGSFSGSAPALARDGSAIAYVNTVGDENRVMRLRLGASEPTTAYESEHPVENVAISADGSRLVFQVMERENWELFVADSDGEGVRRITHEIQHDLFPRFLDNDRVFAVIGEGRHRRSYVHDLRTGERTRLFHNNTIRTVAPEYEWSVNPAGTAVLIVSERDGDTISPERGVYLLDLTRTVAVDDVKARIAAARAHETSLRSFGDRLFGPIFGDVTKAVAPISVSRIYEYENDLFSFGSKYITQPGNAMAITYLADKLRSFGYEPELQWFEPRPGIESANVIATLPGTTNPELIYVVSSHFDSVERGPGADDNTSGTTALLEAARVLRDRPQAATIKFAFFTGEEAGLLGSREFVRRAVEAGDKIVGALNNDMVGFANDNRLDNTIRYSNDGIRDIQHNAARMFSKLITYDARYYKSTDAHAYYDAYGDIVGGIGSYPILGNPHYHQTHDVLETINHQLVAEVSKTTVATLMLLASSPSRLKGFAMRRERGALTVSWSPAVESDVDRYEISYTPPGQPERTVQSFTPSVSLTDAPSGTTIAVRAVNRKRMISWDAVRGIAI